MRLLRTGGGGPRQHGTQALAEMLKEVAQKVQLLEVLVDDELFFVCFSLQECMGL